MFYLFLSNYLIYGVDFYEKIVQYPPILQNCVIKKHKASALLVIVLVTAIVCSTFCLGMARMNQVSLSSSDSNRIALQAQQYAAAESDIVRSTNYGDLANKAKSLISGTLYKREVIVGAESSYDSNIKQKVVTINIYKGSELLPRCSLKVVRLNKESSLSSVPQGAILPWYGSINNIPSGFALCNGQNGTPDLRDRFLVGAGNSYVLGNTGGANTVTLTVAQMPSHAHNRGNMNITGVLNVPNGNAVAYPTYYSASGVFYCNGRATYGGNAGDGGVGGRIYFDASRSWTGVTSYEGGNQPHENRPPYYAVFYIMKL